MSEQKDDRFWELLKQERVLIEERNGKLAKSPKNASGELQEKRRGVETMKLKLDESVGDSELHDEMTNLETVIRAEEDTILEELEPGYVESYYHRLAEIKKG
jgi:hypothetical protein